MTYLKSALIASAALALSASPAFAGDKMHKNHMTKAQAATAYDALKNLSATDRMAWETKIKANMSDKKKVKWATYSEAEQDMWMDKKIMKMMSKEASNTAIAPVSYETTATNSEADIVGKALQTEGLVSTSSEKLLMADGDRVKETRIVSQEADNTAANNAIVVPTVGGSELLTTVSCPIGTTAQPDMTCLVTGDFNPTS